MLFSAVRTATDRLRMSVEPKLTAAEWRTISAHLKPSKTGRRRVDDRGDLAKPLFAEARDEPLQQLFGRRSAARLVVKRARWREADVWDAIMAAGEPTIERMKADERRGYQIIR